MLAKAERSVRAARLLAVDGSFDFAASRAYYAAFYAMEAALLVHHAQTTTHSGSISEFSNLFFKTGVFPKELSKTLSNLFRERHIADDTYDETITAEQAETGCVGAETIVHAVKDYLLVHGFLASA